MQRITGTETCFFCEEHLATQLITSCGHRQYCSGCLERTLRIDVTLGRQSLCPTCRGPFQRGDIVSHEEQLSPILLREAPLIETNEGLRYTFGSILFQGTAGLIK
jgi:hypothetical protein